MSQYPISDEDLKSYLLGTLPQPARALLEDRYLSDDDTYERLLAIEEELIDHHVYGLLSSREWEPLKRSLLLSKDGPERLRFARALEQVRLQTRQTLPGRLADGWRRSTYRKALAPVVIGAIGVLLCVTLWESTSHINRHTAQPPIRGVSPVSSSTVTLFLRSITRDKSAGNLLQIHGGQDRVRLEAEVPGDERNSYHVTIRRADDSQTLTSAAVTRRAVTAGDAVISADLSSASFKDGDYIFTVFMDTGSHSSEEIMAYSFSVVRMPSSQAPPR
jgi:hypothetical protein